MQHGDPAREALGEAAHRLRRQRDLRHQHDAALAERDRLLERPQVDLRLAAAGDAVQQERLSASARRCLIASAARSARRPAPAPASSGGAGRGS